MADITEAKGFALKGVKMTAAGTAVAVIVVLQLTLLSAALDMVTSLALFGIGYAAGKASK